MSLIVFGNVTGLEPSPKFACRVREVGTSLWSDAFVFSATSHPKANHAGGDPNGYFEYHAGWTANWVSFEVAESVSYEVEVEKLYDGGVIDLAIPRPAHRAAASITDGKAYVTLSGPQQVNVDIDGQLEHRNTGLMHTFAELRGEVHTISIFANPMLLDRPDPSDPDVRTVAPGDPVPGPGEFSESTLYFLPGVHTLTEIPECCSTHSTDDGCTCVGYCDNREPCPEGTEGYVAPYLVQSGKRYYIPGDAWLNGWMRSEGDFFHKYGWSSVDQGFFIENTQILGYGTLTGSQLHWKKDDVVSARGIHLLGMRNVSIVGLTLLDHPNHHLILSGMAGADQLELPNTITHVKVIGWRTNGDGIHVWGHWNNITDLFLRTSDDSSYIGDAASHTTWKRIVTWNDANGVPFKLGNQNGGPTVLEDSDVIYHRKSFPYWCGAIFDLRWKNSYLDDIQYIHIKDVRITDPFPTCPMYKIVGSIQNVFFENVIMDRHSTYTTLPNWYCSESLGDQPQFRFNLPGDFGCNLPYGIPNEIIGGEGANENQADITNPLYNVSNLHFTNVQINGTRVYDLVYDPQHRGAFTIDGQVYELVFDQPPPPPPLPFGPPPPVSPLLPLGPPPPSLPFVESDAAWQTPACWLDETGAEHYVVLPEGVSATDDHMVERFTRWWGAAPTGTCPHP